MSSALVLLFPSLSIAVVYMANIGNTITVDEICNLKVHLRSHTCYYKHAYSIVITTTSDKT